MIISHIHDILNYEGRSSQQGCSGPGTHWVGRVRWTGVPSDVLAGGWRAMCRGSRGRRDDEEIPKRMSPPLLSSGYSTLISHWTKRWWCGLLPPQMTTPWCYVLGFIWRQHTEYDTHESSCASPSNATPGVRPLGRTPRISSTATAFLWRQWPDPSAAFKYGLGLYPRQAIGRSATDWWKSYRDHVQIIYLLSPNNQWPAINWQQFIHWLGSRNKQVPARHSYSRYEYKEII